MKALVTGCAGFIGSHLCDRLLAGDFDVVGVDSLTDYYDPRIKRANLQTAQQNPRFTFFQGNLLALDLKPLVRSADVVFHLAAQPGVRGSWGEKFTTYVENNVLATQKLLEAVKDVPGIQKFVYSSSSSVYGQIQKEAVDEDHRTLPHSPYGATKLAGEHLCFLYRANYNVPVVSLRLFSVYGPRQRPDMAFARLAYSGMTGKKFPLYGDGRQERDFTYVLDVVEAMILAASNSAANGVFNIGGGHVLSMQQVIGIAEKIMNSKIQIESKHAERGDVQRTSADITKSRTILSYKPTHAFEDGLRGQVEFMKTHLDLYHDSLSGS